MVEDLSDPAPEEKAPKDSASAMVRIADYLALNGNRAERKADETLCVDRRRL